MSFKILITDPLSDKGLDLLRNEGFDVVIAACSNVTAFEQSILLGNEANHIAV